MSKYEKEEGVVRYHISMGGELSSTPLYYQIRRPAESKESYRFPILAKMHVQDAIASAGDIDVAGALSRRTMENDSLTYNRKDFTSLTSKVKKGFMQYKKKGELIENFYDRLRESLVALAEGVDVSPAAADTYNFAYRFGAAVAYGFLTGVAYDTEHTYFPTDEEIEALSNDKKEILEIAGLHTVWEAREAQTLARRPSPFRPMLDLVSRGATHLQFEENNLTYQMELVSAKVA